LESKPVPLPEEDVLVQAPIAAVVPADDLQGSIKH
jgi:hypothetical protein